METVLLTGGAGVIGRSLTQELIKQTFRVVVLDDLSSGQLCFLPKSAHFIQGKVENDLDLERAFDRHPDYVIHLAALFANQNSVEHPEQDLVVSGMGALKVLKFSQHHKIRKIVFVSSACVFGSKESLDESILDYHPETPYGMTKLLGEQYCKFWAEHGKLNTVIVRPFNSYGPGELPGKYRSVIPNFLWLAMNKKPLVITGTGEETRDFTYITDTVRGILLALFRDTHPGEVFHIASGQSTRIMDVARSINEITQNPTPIEFRPYRPWDRVLHRRTRIEKAATRLGYCAEVQLLRGLEETFLWVKNNAEVITPDIV